MRKRRPKTGPGARTQSAQERAANFERKERRRQKRKEGQKQTFIHHLLRSRVAWLVFAALLGGAAAVGFLRGKDDTSPAAPGDASAAPTPTDNPPLPETKRYQYEIDGVKVQSDTVLEEEFRKAYEKAKSLVGRRYWQPIKPLRVEYGNATPTHFQQLRIDIPNAAETESGFLNDAMDEMMAQPHSLAHELVHFLLGPEQKKWPSVFKEFIASSANDRETSAPYVYEELDAPWIQTTSPHGEIFGTPLTGGQYAALEKVAQKHREKIASVVQAALANHELNFDNLSEFLAQFNIQHHIFRPGQQMEYNVFIHYEKPGEAKALLYLRGKKIAGNIAEGSFDGPVRFIFIDNQGLEYVGEEIMMHGVTIVPLPQTLNPLIEARAMHTDGWYSQRL